MKRWKHKFSIMILMMLLLFSNKLSTYAEEPGDASNIVASDECGENATWALDDEGLLTITGSGSIECGWSAYKEQIKEVIIADGITWIGGHAFRDCSNLTSVIMADTVVGIDSYSFCDCTKLKSVKLSNKLTNIYGAAFMGCTSLENIVFPEPSFEVESIGIDTAAFKNCKNLRSVVFPQIWLGLGTEVFNGCDNLEEIYFYDSRISWIYGDYENEDCIPKSTTLYSYCGSAAYEYAKKYNREFLFLDNAGHSFDEWIIEREPTEAKEGLKTQTCSVCGYDNSETIPVVESAYVAKGTCGANLTWTLDKEGCLTINGSGDMGNYGGVGAWYGYESQIKTVVLPDGLTKIGHGAFSNCVNLKEITIPDSVTHIETNAFGNCTSLESIDLSDNLTMLGYGVFSNTESLISLRIPKTVKIMPMEETYEPLANLKYLVMEGDAPETGGARAQIDSIKPLWILVSENAEGYDVYPWTEYNIYYGSSIHIKNLIVQEVEDVKYSGEAVNADIVIMDGSYRLEEGVDYTVEYANNIDIGTADATVIGQGWYSGTQIINFNIVETLPENSGVDGSASGVTTLTGEIAYTTAYTLTIPASISDMDLSQAAETTLGAVSVTKQNADADFDPAKRVDVAIEYSGELLNTEDSSKKVIYKLQQSTEEEFVDITSGDKLNFLASDIESGSAFYNFKAIITETNKSGGTYSGNINFSAMVENMK